MKSLSKASIVAASVVILALAAFASSPAMADGLGQVGGGPIYRIKNITQNVDYTNPASANACDELEYSVRLHNPGYGSISDLNVTMTLPSATGTSNTSTMTATYQGGAVSSTTATATVDLTSAQSISYVSGSTQLLDVNGNVVKSLPDGVTQSGINLGDLNGSTTEYVNFEAKVNCPVTPPVTPTYACTLLGLTAEENRTVKISNFATSQSNGATFSNAVVNWGDSTELTSTSPIGQTHQYAADGKYTVTATANFSVNVNGQIQTKSATSESCTQVVTFSSTTPPTVTPPTTPVTPPATPAAPTALVNTGPGSVIGLFAASTLGGTVLYRRLLARRLSRQ
jgi:hypothetical protein